MAEADRVYDGYDRRPPVSRSQGQDMVRFNSSMAAAVISRAAVGVNGG